MIVTKRGRFGNMGESTLWGTLDDFFMFWVIIKCKMF
jgi:hypothetical protein